MDYEQKILEYFEGEKKIKGLTPETDLFAGGYVNSLFSLQAVMFLEKTFSVKIPRKEINKENFSTVRKMAELIGRIKK